MECFIKCLITMNDEEVFCKGCQDNFHFACSLKKNTWDRKSADLKQEQRCAECRKKRKLEPEVEDSCGEDDVKLETEFTTQINKKLKTLPKPIIVQLRSRKMRDEILMKKKISLLLRLNKIIS